MAPDVRHSHGFSLLEMMTVAALIMILATISSPFFHTAVVRAREAVLRGQLFTLRSQIDRFTLDNYRAPPDRRPMLSRGPSRRCSPAGKWSATVVSAKSRLVATQRSLRL
jgi:prepilin-type N-terminal cleavage/methylation domain-containing protein